MPEKDGWHTCQTPIGDRLYRWHHCEGAERDELVPDTVTARREHERVCLRRRKKRRERAEQDRKRANTARLRELNRLRKEAA
jgi:hypothetical protein